MAESAFIAYAHEPHSQRAATALAKRLRRDGVSVWIDQWDLQPGQEWRPAIESALQKAGAVLAIIGKSDYMQGMLKNELQAAINQRKTVIPVLTEGASFSDIPEIIAERQAVFSTDDENAYRKLLGALGISRPDPDELEDLSLYERLRRYVAND